MIVVLKQQISEKQKARVARLLEEQGYTVNEVSGHTKRLFAAVGNAELDMREVASLEGVSSVIPISQPFSLVSRATKSEDTIVSVGRVKIGGGRIAIIAGPYRIESREQITQSAQVLREAGAVMLHGGTYTGTVGEAGLALLQEAAQKSSLATICEVTNPSDIPLLTRYVDMLEIGGRSMENEGLLEAAGATGMPIMLKRGRSSTIEEWLIAAELIVQSGSDNVVLCEQGIRTYERATRNTLDVSAIPVVQQLTHLPVIGDPSQATGRREMVAPMSLALIASGASGLMVEVQCTADQGYSDGPHFLYASQFEKLMRDLQALSQVVGKSLERIPRITLPTKSKAEGIATSVESERLIVAFQGERGAYSELAIRRSFGEETEVLPCKSFPDAFDAVLEGRALYAMMPVENTLGGTILQNLDLLERHEAIEIVGEQQIRIIHNLIGFAGTKLEDIREVYSHPQGLAQCTDFLETTLAHAEAISFFDTAGAVGYVKEEGDRSKAAIAGVPAAKVYGMEILAEGIESNPRNYTRFYIISREENAVVIRSAAPVNRAALVFTVRDRPGSLFDVLSVLSTHGLNMKKLESRPIAGKPWEYSFFVEIETGEAGAYEAALTQLEPICRSLRVLGTFASGR